MTYQGLNRIQIAEAAGSDVVLRFHFMETLRCRPGCGVERFEMAGDRVGFFAFRIRRRASRSTTRTSASIP